MQSNSILNKELQDIIMMKSFGNKKSLKKGTARLQSKFQNLNANVNQITERQMDTINSLVRISLQSSIKYCCLHLKTDMIAILCQKKNILNIPILMFDLKAF